MWVELCWELLTNKNDKGVIGRTLAGTTGDLGETAIMVVFNSMNLLIDFVALSGKVTGVAHCEEHTENDHATSLGFKKLYGEFQLLVGLLTSLVCFTLKVVFNRSRQPFSAKIV